LSALFYLLIGLGISCILLSSLLFRKGHPFYLLGLLIFNAGLFCLHFALSQEYHPYLYRFYYPYSSLLISLGLYVFFNNLHTSHLSKRDKLLLGMTLIEPIFIHGLALLRYIDPELTFWFWEPLKKLSYRWHPSQTGSDTLVMNFQVMFFYIFAFSFIIVLFKLFQVLKKAEKQHLSFFSTDSFNYYRWVRRFVVFCTVIGLYAIILVISNEFISVGWYQAFTLYIAMGIFGLGVFGLGIYTPLRYAKEKDFKQFIDYIERSHTTIINEKTQNSKASPPTRVQLELNKAKLISLLENEKVYNDPQLTLSGLAKQLDTSPRTLSRTISEGCSTNFFELINSYRIEQIKEHLLHEDYQHYAIVSIGLEAGFNSKSTFYDAFKKNTGMTPSQYKKHNS